jgi:hypothetical protein
MSLDFAAINPSAAGRVTGSAYPSPPCPGSRVLYIPISAMGYGDKVRRSVAALFGSRSRWVRPRSRRKVVEEQSALSRPRPVGSPAPSGPARTHIAGAVGVPSHRVGRLRDEHHEPARARSTSLNALDISVARSRAAKFPLPNDRHNARLPKGTHLTPAE